MTDDTRLKRFAARDDVRVHALRLSNRLGAVIDHDRPEDFDAESLRERMEAFYESLCALRDVNRSLRDDRAKRLGFK